MVAEFDIIRRYFTRSLQSALLGVGDDAALLQVSPGNDLAVSSDMLVGGTHFFPDTDPFKLGHKTLAVNLSDMAAMGAKPRWATLAIAMPGIDEVWLEQFSAGFFALAQQHSVELVGGDTTRGPLALCVTIFGEVPPLQALLRSGAKPGDEIWVSGNLGDAALALAHQQGDIVLGEAEFISCASHLHQPQPRVELGVMLRNVATSAIDISDGLLADLGHILEASNIGATIDLSAVPVSQAVGRFLGHPRALRCALAGGDDYELCFTAPSESHAEILNIASKLDLLLTPIGRIVSGRACTVLDESGNPIKLESSGYDHFR